MSLTKPTEFETMKVLYNLWENNHLSVRDIKHFLLVEYNVNLITLNAFEIKAESIDKKTKYSINKFGN